MSANRLAGPGAGSEKYDILTAMAVAGLSGGPQSQSTMLRLIALVTARYNWISDEITVGQRDIAMMWSVNERTVKREIKRLTSSKLLIQKRPGVRGRVAAYRLNIAEIYRLSEPVWTNVGPDFADRMDQRVPKPHETVVRVDFQSRAHLKLPTSATPWQRALSHIEAENPTSVAAWYSKLSVLDQSEAILVLQAPSKFVAQYVQTHLLERLKIAVRTEYGEFMNVSVVGPN